MTDDIVEYLRLSRTRFNRHAEAADEIERLRDERLSWINIAFCTHCLPQHDHYCAEHLQGKR